MSNRLDIRTSTQNEYFIETGYDLTARITEYLAAEYPGQKLALVIDEEVRKHHGKRLSSILSECCDDLLTYTIPSGEQSKSIQHYSEILDLLLTEGIERNTPLLAVGGGVTGDLAGFVAASALRGLPLIHMPTTLLAMVDSSIGGKTGINHREGKNLIGAFYQPKAVFSDLKFLETLPEKEWVNGLSEILKYGYISSPGLFESLENLIRKEGFSKPGNWEEVVRESAAIKCDIVQKDVSEAGVREYLNFGHTFAHVIERVGGYRDYSHGEAVYMGMWGAVQASKEYGASVDASNLEPFRSLYRPKPLTHSEEELTALMKYDKKVKQGNIRLVLLEEKGKPCTRVIEDAETVHAGWKFIKEVFN